MEFESISETPADRLAQALAYVPHTQREVAGRLGMSETHLSAVKNGHEPLSPRVARGLQEAFGIRAEWLLHGTGVMLDAQSELWGATTTTSPGAVSAIYRKTFFCGACGQPVALNRTPCPHCGCRLLWPADPAEAEAE